METTYHKHEEWLQISLNYRAQVTYYGNEELQVTRITILAHNGIKITFENDSDLCYETAIEQLKLLVENTDELYNYLAGRFGEK